MLKSKKAKLLVQNIINSSDFLQLADSYQRYMDEFFSSSMLKNMSISTLLIAAYEAGLKIGVSIDATGSKFFSPYGSGNKFFKISGSLKDTLDSYHNLELLNAA